MNSTSCEFIKFMRQAPVMHFLKKLDLSSEENIFNDLLETLYPEGEDVKFMCIYIHFGVKVD